MTAKRTSSAKPKGKGRLASGKPKGRDLLKTDQPPGTLSRAQIAAALDVSPNRINKWVADGAPVAHRGTQGRSSYYELEPFKQWLAARSRPKDGDDLSLGEARARLATAQAEKYETENLVRAGELVERAVVAAEGRAVLSALKAKLLALPRLAVIRGVVPREQELSLKAIIVDALREMARWNMDADAPGNAA